MLISAEEELDAKYHVLRWDRKIGNAIEKIVSAQGADALVLDPEEEQDPLQLNRRPIFRSLTSLGNKLQVFLYCIYQLGRHWQHFLRESKKHEHMLQDGWDVLLSTK